jgi:hypothetical protein
MVSRGPSPFTRRNKSLALKISPNSNQEVPSSIGYTPKRYMKDTKILRKSKEFDQIKSLINENNNSLGFSEALTSIRLLSPMKAQPHMV